MLTLCTTATLLDKIIGTGLQFLVANNCMSAEDRNETSDKYNFVLLVHIQEMHLFKFKCNGVVCLAIFTYICMWAVSIFALNCDKL